MINVCELKKKQTNLLDLSCWLIMERETRIQQPVDANMAPKVVNASAGQA